MACPEYWLPWTTGSGSQAFWPPRCQEPRRNHRDAHQAYAGGTYYVWETRPRMAKIRRWLHGPHARGYTEDARAGGPAG